MIRRSPLALHVLLALLAMTRPEATAGQALTLAAAADSALANHPATRGSGARVESARAALDAARGSLLPGLAASGQLTRFQEPMVVAPLHGFDPTNPPDFDRTLVHGRVGFQYTLFDGGDRRALIRGADAQAEAAGYGHEATEMHLLADVAERYLAVLSARALLEAAEAHLAALAEERDRAQRHLDAGTAAEVEVVRATASLQDARAQVAGARARLDLAERGLARAMGVEPGALAGRPLAEPRPAPTTPPRPTADNPALLRAGRAVEVAEARLDQERAGRFPRLQAGAGLLDFGTATGGHVLEWQAGVELTWPLFTGGTRASSIRRAEAELDAARSELALAELEVDGAVDAAEAARLEADARVEALAASVAQWDEVARIEALSLEAGAGEQRDFLRAQAGVFQARAGFARARHDAVLARVRLAHARGTLSRNWIDTALESQP